jgi:hypothetical protein
MKDLFIALSFGFVALIFATQNAYAAPSCAPRAEVLEMLGVRYSEERQSIGIAANNSVIEVFASEAGTWSIIATMTNGETCLIASGESFETITDTLESGEPAYPRAVRCG